MKATKRNLAYARVKLALSDYQSNGDRRHLAAAVELMADFMEVPEIAPEINAFLLSDKTLPPLPKKIGVDEARENGLIAYFWKNWEGKASDQDVYGAIVDVLRQNDLPGWGEADDNARDRVRKRIERIKRQDLDNG